MGSSFKNMMMFVLWFLIIMWLGLRLFDERAFRFYRPYTQVQNEQPLTQYEFDNAMKRLHERLDSFK